MNKLSISLVFIAIVIFSVASFANAAISSVPEPFQRSDENSRLTISYADLNSLLDAVVLNTGRSDRKKASPQKSSTGTRMKLSVNRATVNEGNRFFYEIFAQSEDNRRTLHHIRLRLESLPSVNPLENFSRD